jgi:dipeptidyl aminopeptidase/acylaminoacyl peptidase
MGDAWLLAQQTQTAKPCSGFGGSLLFIRGSALVAQPFDLKRLELTGEPVTVADPIRIAFNTARGYAFSASETGTLVYRTGAEDLNRQMGWFDRTGKALGPIASPGEYSNPRLSPDEKQIAVDRLASGNRDIWLIEIARAIATRLTFDPAADTEPVWSADGTRIVYTSEREGRLPLYQKLASGAGNEELLLEPVGKRLVWKGMVEALINIRKCHAIGEAL